MKLNVKMRSADLFDNGKIVSFNAYGTEEACLAVIKALQVDWLLVSVFLKEDEPKE